MKKKKREDVIIGDWPIGGEKSGGGHQPRFIGVDKSWWRLFFGGRL